MDKTDLTFKELVDFVTWEINRLDDGSKLATGNERILWAAGKISEETGEVWNDVLALVGLARPEKIENFKIENLAEEIADVILVTFILAKRLNIDISDAVKKKIEIVKSRDYKDFYDTDPLKEDIMTKIPFCHKCASSIAKTRAFTQNSVDCNSFVLVGCKEEDKIKNYDDAVLLCPVILKLKEQDRAEHGVFG
jgi:NTP pyrophosphatase (non-canonical NTP hydrolase)